MSKSYTRLPRYGRGHELPKLARIGPSETSAVWKATKGDVSNNNSPWYTTNGGASWTAVSIAGVPTSGTTGWSNAYYLDRDICAADRVNANTFYLYNDGSGSGAAAGIYKSTNGGAVWSHVYSGTVSSFSTFNAKLRAVPNMAGNLFFTGGPENFVGNANDPLIHSTDGGVTWNAVPNVYEVSDVGFGKAKTGTTTPAIYIDGWVNSKYGIWESDDDAQTWTQVGLWPLNSIDQIKDISGDMNAYGRVYVGFGGSGWTYGNTANAQIPPILSSIATSSVTASTTAITWTTDQSSNSKVVYGTTTAYGSASSSASLVTSHSISLSGLATSTTYHFAVVSANAQGSGFAGYATARIEMLLYFGQQLASQLPLVADFLRVIDGMQARACSRRTIIGSSEPHSGAPSIRFEDVEFSYPNGPPVLRQLSTTIKAGETVALVGVSGAGKSTILTLLLGLRSPVAGRILINELDLTLIDPEAWRERVAVVFQDARLLARSVGENIAIGARPSEWDEISRDTEAIRLAAQEAAADAFIRQMPNGYDSDISEGGASLSGGQQQRIAIARAAVRRSDVLLLDEPTSSLDAESEAEVRAALDRLRAGRTTILVAHRLTTMALADRVLLLESGRVIEEGTPAELASQSIRFRALMGYNAR